MKRPANVPVGGRGVRVVDYDAEDPRFTLADHDSTVYIGLTEFPALIAWLRETYPQHFAETPKPVSDLEHRVAALERRLDAARDAL